MLLGFLYGVYWGLEIAVHPAVQLLAGFAVQLGVPIWLGGEIRRRGYHAAFDARTFLFFAWPVAGPYYLFRTRGWRGVYAILGALGLWMGGFIAGAFAGAVV